MHQPQDEQPAVERPGRRLAEYSYARAMERIGRMQLRNVKRADLHKHYNEVFQTFSNTQVAEYLGMSDGELSRAKRAFQRAEVKSCGNADRGIGKPGIFVLLSKPKAHDKNSTNST